jgi:peptidoglycan/LPS O-acetylase OafA/YrhL
VFGLIWSIYGRGYPLTGSGAHNDNATNLISQFVMYCPLGRLPEFIFGILLFVYWSADKNRISSFWLVVASVAFGLIVLVSQAIIPDVLLHNGLTAIVWAPLILAGASMRFGLLNWPPLVFLGRISFSLYLLHMATARGVLAVNKYVLDGAISSFPWLVALGTTLLAISISALTYKLIEEPGRRYIVQRWQRYHARRVAVLSTPVSVLQQSPLNATPRRSDNPV